MADGQARPIDRASRAAMTQSGAEMTYRALIPGRELALVGRVIHQAGRWYWQVGEAQGHWAARLGTATGNVERRLAQVGATDWTCETRNARGEVLTCGRI